MSYLGMQPASLLRAFHCHAGAAVIATFPNSIIQLDSPLLNNGLNMAMRMDAYGWRPKFAMAPHGGINASMCYRGSWQVRPRSAARRGAAA